MRATTRDLASPFLPVESRCDHVGQSAEEFRLIRGEQSLARAEYAEKARGPSLTSNWCSERAPGSAGHENRIGIELREQAQALHHDWPFQDERIAAQRVRSAAQMFATDDPYLPAHTHGDPECFPFRPADRIRTAIRVEATLGEVQGVCDQAFDGRITRG